MVLAHPCLSVLWLLQPDKLRELQESAAMSESGLMPRFLIAETKAEPREEPEERHCIPETVKAAWSGLIHTLLSIEPTSHGQQPRISKATHLRPPPRRPHQDTWASYSQAWLETQKKRIPKTLSQKTYDNYRGPLKSFNQWLGKDTSLPIAAITGDHLQDWCRHGIEAGLSPPGTMLNATKLLTTIFQRAIDEGFCARNPVNLITGKPAAPTSALPSPRNRWTRCSITSARPSSKTGKTLRIPLVKPLASYLAALMAKPASSLFLAPSLANTEVAGSDRLSAQFAQILVDCGISGRRIE